MRRSICSGSLSRLCSRTIAGERSLTTYLPSAGKVVADHSRRRASRMAGLRLALLGESFDALTFQCPGQTAARQRQTAEPLPQDLIALKQRGRHRQQAGVVIEPLRVGASGGNNASYRCRARGDRGSAFLYSARFRRCSGRVRPGWGRNAACDRVGFQAPGQRRRWFAVGPRHAQGRHRAHPQLAQYFSHVSASPPTWERSLVSSARPPARLLLL